MTRKEMKDYLANGLAAGGITAAIALAVTRNRKEKQFKPNDIESGNAIVVPIHKDKFLEGLPTPDQLAASRGATAAGAASGESMPAGAVAGISSTTLAVGMPAGASAFFRVILIAGFTSADPDASVDGLAGLMGVFTGVSEVESAMAVSLIGWVQTINS